VSRNSRFPFNPGDPTSSVRQARALGFYGHHRSAARHKMTRRMHRLSQVPTGDSKDDQQRAQDWKTAIMRRMPVWMRRAVGRLLP